ncbi:MAG: RNA polymerase sigma factor [Alphaproteobacteria bacterium]
MPANFPAARRILSSDRVRLREGGVEHGKLAERQAARDGALARAAMNGCAESFCLLFERYRPRLYAAAVGLLGYGSDAEDAVHDTFLAAIGKLRQLRDPLAVGGWLYAILRNRCLMQRRRSRPQVGGDQADRHFREMPDEDRIESRIERRELRAWVWSALQHLPESLRATVVLRYFGSCDSYGEVAAILGVPVGTVRSRLSDAKARLAELLLAAAGGGDAEAEACQAERKAFYEDGFKELYRGRRDAFLSHYADDLHLVWSTGTQSRGRAHFDVEMDSDLATGVRFDPRRIMASGNLTVIEGPLQNPPEQPDLCPPACVLVMQEGARQVQRLHIHLSPRPLRPSDDNRVNMPKAGAAAELW